jgi:Ankyrin repeats (3 copies)/Ankyrin repeats (many copies)
MKIIPDDSLSDCDYLINIIGGCYATFESNGTFDTCIRIEPYAQLTKKVLEFRETWDLSVFQAEDIQRAASWFIDTCVRLKYLSYWKDAYVELYQFSYRELLSAACSDNRVQMVEYFTKFVKIQNDDYAIVCEYGSLDVLKWIHAHGVWRIHKFDLDVIGPFQIACINNQVEIAKWLLENNLTEDEPSGENLFDACEYGALEIVQFLRSIGIDMHEENDSPFITACQNNRLHVAKYLYTFGVEKEVVQNMFSTALVGFHSGKEDHEKTYREKENMIKWLYSTGDIDFNNYYTRTSILQLRLSDEILDLLHSMGFTYNEDAIWQLCTHGRLNTLKWLYSHRHIDIALIKTEKCFQIACREGDLPIAKWLHSIGAPFTMEAYQLAKSRREVHITSWLDLL